MHVISVENLSKSYRLGQISGGTLSEDLNRWWARIRGQPDPYLKIGQVDHGNRRDDFVYALQDVSFTVDQGEVLGIIGRNGAGKSTLLKILSRVTAPTSGKVKIKGRIASLLEVGTGFHPDLTGRENIYLNGAILGMKKSEIDRKFDEIVDFAEIEKFIDTPVKRYSSGMYVRLAFAVAAHLEPEILIVDEVLAVGDAAFQKKCLGKMGEVASEGRTVLFVSHNMESIRNLCERVILIKGGYLECSGPSPDVVREYMGFTERLSHRTLRLTSTAIDLLEVRLCTVEGSLSDTFPFEQGLFLEIYYDVHYPVSGLSLGVIIYAETGEAIFTTASRSASTQPELVKGNGVSRVRIPGYFLAPGEYSVFINAHTIADLFCVAPNAIAFRIQDSGREVLGREGQMKWPGFINPLFQWENQSELKDGKNA